MSFLRKGCLVSLAAVLLIVGAPLLWRGAVKFYYGSTMYAQPEAPARPVAIVFGAAVYGNGRLSAVLRDRVDTAIALYHSGQASRLLMSGGAASGGYDEPAAMKQYAVERGVVEHDIMTDHCGQRTDETG